MSRDEYYIDTLFGEKNSLVMFVFSHPDGTHLIFPKYSKKYPFAFNSKSPIPSYFTGVTMSFVVTTNKGKCVFYLSNTVGYFHEITGQAKVML
jgi:hypothetical protein